MRASREGIRQLRGAIRVQVAKDAADYQHWNFRFLNLSDNFRSKTACPRQAVRFLLSRGRSLPIKVKSRVTKIAGVDVMFFLRTRERFTAGIERRKQELS
jgi:hypothetical protein